MPSFPPLLPVSPAVLQGTDPFHPPETLGKIAKGGEAQNLGNEGKGVVRFPQKEAAFLDAAGDEVIDGGDPKLPPEGVGQVIFIEVGQLGQLVQAQVFLEVVVDIPPDQIALPAGPGVGGLAGEGGVPLAVQPDQHHLQKAPADPLIAREGGFRLLEHQPQAAHQLLPAGAEV